MARAPSPLDVLRADRERALRYAEKAGVARVRRLLEKAQTDLARRLRGREFSSDADEPFTLTRQRATLAQIRETLRALQKGMRPELLATATEAAERQAEGTLRYLRAAEARFRGIVAPLPLNEAALMDAAVKGAEASALRRISSDPAHPGRLGVIERYGDAVMTRFEEQLRLSVVTRRSWAETREALVEESPFLKDAPAHWAERIARTEAMNASNAASQETIAGAAKELDGTVKILCATFDGRTAADSYAVHGQIRRPEEPFDTWQGPVLHPPSRPNDREVVVPHRLAWPLPAALKPRSDGEVAARWAKEGRKGSPPRRPRLSTVKLDS